MLVLKLELHSARTGEIKTIGQVIIANVGGSTERGNYEIKVAHGSRLSLRETYLHPQRQGRVENYPRLSYNVWRLVIRALKSAFPEEK